MMTTQGLLARIIHWSDQDCQEGLLLNERPMPRDNGLTALRCSHYLVPMDYQVDLRQVYYKKVLRLDESLMQSAFAALREALALEVQIVPLTAGLWQIEAKCWPWQDELPWLMSGHAKRLLSGDQGLLETEIDMFCADFFTGQQRPVGLYAWPATSKATVLCDLDAADWQRFLGQGARGVFHVFGDWSFDRLPGPYLYQNLQGTYLIPGEGAWTWLLSRFRCFL